VLGENAPRCSVGYRRPEPTPDRATGGKGVGLGDRERLAQELSLVLDVSGFACRTGRLFALPGPASAKIGAVKT
jgi:hypothetical protein